MIEIKLLVMAVCAALFWWGGYSWKPARRFIMPCALTLFAVLYLKFSLVPVSMLSCIGIFCLGYGEKSPLRHCFGNGWGRGVWGLLGGLCLSLGLFLSGNLYWYLLLPYLALNFILENALKDIPQVIGDPIIGGGFACIVLLIH